MSCEAELPERPEPRGGAGWLRFGAIVAGALAAVYVAFVLWGPLDALAASWGLPHWLHLGQGLAVMTGLFGAACVTREWSRPARRFLLAHGLPNTANHAVSRRPDRPDGVDVGH
jgi:hypothetical protein